MSILTAILDYLRRLVNGPLTKEELEKALDQKAAAANQKLDWRNSIVDLMKLTDQDSSLHARKKMAMELGYTGSLDGSAEMNIWLHKKVMEELASTLYRAN